MAKKLIRIFHSYIIFISLINLSMINFKMKKTILLSAVMLLGATMSAKIWRVNNTGITTDFTSLQTAHDNAGVLSGDTLHLEPSSGNYGALSLTKKLIIIGNGYLLNQNLNLQANPINSKTGAINFEAGSSGSVIMGLEIVGNVIIRTSNITINRNYSGYTIFFDRTTASYSNILISQNYGFVINSSGTGIASYSNINILNNVAIAFSNTGNVLQSYFSGTIANNVITTTGTPADFFVIKNNISTSTTNTAVIYGASTFTYNTCPTASGWPTGNNNTLSATLSTIFNQTGSNDAYYTLKSGSSAIGTGESGVDRGAFGGSNPYVLSGIPPVPSIYSLSAPTNSNGNQINITISTKTNN